MDSGKIFWKTKKVYVLSTKNYNGCTFQSNIFCCTYGNVIFQSSMLFRSLTLEEQNNLSKCSHLLISSLFPSVYNFNKITIKMNYIIFFNQITTNHSQAVQCDQSSLKKVKPWVFKPKKVVYGGKSSKKKATYGTHHWNDEENQKYVEFLMKFKDVIEGGKKIRRKWHLNRMMSKAIGSRSYEQCRSHHQKMIKYYKDIDGIIQYLSKEEKSVKVDESEDHGPIKEVSMREVEDMEEDSMMQKYSLRNIFEESGDINLPFFFEEEPLI